MTNAAIRTITLPRLSVGEVPSRPAVGAETLFLDHEGTLKSVVGATGEVESFSSDDSEYSIQVDASVQRGSVSYVFEGDSMTAPGGENGSLIGHGEDYPAQLMGMRNFVGTGTWVNQAIGGQPISTLLTQYATQVYPHRPAAEEVQTVYLFLWTFNNDYDSRDEGSIWNDWVTYVTQARADGFTIVALTVPRRRPPSSNGLALQKPEQEVIRRNLNERLRRSTLVDILIDVDALFPGPAGSNTVYDADLSIDGTHFTALGNTFLARHIDAVWPGKGDSVRHNRSGDRLGFVVATEVFANGSNGGTTGNTTWNARNLTSLDCDTDDVARLVSKISYSYSHSGASGLVVRQRITGNTSGASAFVVFLQEVPGPSSGTGECRIVQVQGTFQNGETLTTSGGASLTAASLATSDGSLYLAPGTYLAEAEALAIMSGPAKLRLTDISSNVVVLGLATAAETTAVSYSGAIAKLIGKFTISNGTILYLQHYTTTGQSSFGKGLNVGDGTSNKPAFLKLTKIN